MLRHKPGGTLSAVTNLGSQDGRKQAWHKHAGLPTKWSCESWFYITTSIIPGFPTVHVHPAWKNRSCIIMCCVFYLFVQLTWLINKKFPTLKSFGMRKMISTSTSFDIYHVFNYLCKPHKHCVKVQSSQGHLEIYMYMMYQQSTW